MNPVKLTGNFLCNICRLCLTSSESMTDIFCFSSTFGESVADILMKCTPVQITKSERMPKYICQLCYNQLENVHKFQTQAVQSERTLQDYFQQLDASHRQRQPDSSINFFPDDSVNQDSGADVGVKTEFVELNDRFNEANNRADNKTTESTRGQSNVYEKMCLNTGKDGDIQIKKENIVEDTPLIETPPSDFNEDTSETFESQLSSEETNSFYKCQDIDKRVIKTHRCDICNKHFGQLCHLNTHKRTHTGEKPYQCEVCYKSFTQSGHLEAHKSTHSGEKPYRCNVCNKSFIQSRYLKYHKRTHTDEKPYRCDVCSKSYTQLHNLNSHKRTHTGEKPFQCDVCNKCFIELNLLNRHKLIHTGEKPYQCDVCNKCFTQSSHLKGHKLTHSGVKPYQCDVCDMCFVQSSHLRDHKSTHSGEKPYKCDVCNKCFTQLSSLNRHKLIHTGEKPYQCDVCNKLFIREEHLNKHKLIHTVKTLQFDFCKVEPLD